MISQNIGCVSKSVNHLKGIFKQIKFNGVLSTNDTIYYLLNKKFDIVSDHLINNYPNTKLILFDIKYEKLHFK